MEVHHVLWVLGVLLAMHRSSAANFHEHDHMAMDDMEAMGFRVAGRRGQAGGC